MFDIVERDATCRAADGFAEAGGGGGGFEREADAGEGGGCECGECWFSGEGTCGDVSTWVPWRKGNVLGSFMPVSFAGTGTGTG